MEGGHKVVKWLMFIFNLLFWVSGIGLIIAGAVAQTAYKPYLPFLDSTYVSAPVLLIVVGAVVTIVAFFGCCGSSKESYGLLMTFAVLLGIIFAVELAGGIVGYIERGRVASYVEHRIQANFNNYNETTDAAVWNNMQKDLKCCGMCSYIDWPNNHSATVPQACCKVSNPDCDRNDTALGNCSLRASPDICPIYTQGCAPVLQQRMEDNIAVIGGVGIGIAFIQLIGIAMSCFLALRIRKGYTYS